MISAPCALTLMTQRCSTAPQTGHNILAWTSLKAARWQPRCNRYMPTEALDMSYTTMSLPRAFVMTAGLPLLLMQRVRGSDGHTLGFVLYKPPVVHSDLCWLKQAGVLAGVLGFDEAGGFWLLHSAPKFPDSPANKSYGGIYRSQTIHAQAFLCISLSAATTDAIGSLLQVTNLYMYSPTSLPADLAAAFPSISLLIQPPRPRLLRASRQQNLTFTSRGGPACFSFRGQLAWQMGDWACSLRAHLCQSFCLPGSCSCLKAMSLHQLQASCRCCLGSPARVYMPSHYTMVGMQVESRF